MSNKSKKDCSVVCRYFFVDEGGDSILFSKGGKSIVGEQGCSRFFILGLLDVREPEELNNAMSVLRNRLLGDAYMQAVPSMQPTRRKTAFAFHAKDDIPEVRREVFSLLHGWDGIKYYAVVTDKRNTLNYVALQNLKEPTYRYNPDELYDYLARRLFKNHLHTDSKYKIMFSKRGKSTRTKALRDAIETARTRYAQEHGIENHAEIEIISSTPQNDACLQAVDYFTWALQRVYERGEERYIAYMWDKVKLVQDIDDKREEGYGVYYSKRKPISSEALSWRVK